MESLITQIGKISSFVWGPYFLIPMLVGTGIFMTFRLKLIQVRKTGHKYSVLSANDEQPHGRLLWHELNLRFAPVLLNERI